MPLDFERRAVEVFQSSAAAIGQRLDALTAEHAAKGLLKSGSTVKRAIRIFDEETSQAVDQVTREMAKRIEGRGREWTNAAEGVSRALNNHLADARKILAKPFKMAGAVGDSAAGRAADKLLAGAAEERRAQLAQFRERWTAPAAKPWKDRHPYLDRIIFAIAGAVITTGVGYAFGLIG